MRVIIFAVCALFCLTAIARAQNTGGLRGTVTDWHDGRAVRNATVIVRSGAVDLSTTTDAHGRFLFMALPPGRVLVMVEPLGLSPTSFHACVRADQFRDLAIHVGWDFSVPYMVRTSRYNEMLQYAPNADVTADLYSLGSC